MPMTPLGAGRRLISPRIQGADVCGTVAAIGAEAPDELLGKRVLVDTWLRDWNDPLNRDKCRYFGSECNGGKGTFKDLISNTARNFLLLI